MGTENRTLYSRRTLSAAGPGHTVFPYPLRRLEIDRPDFVERLWRSVRYEDVYNWGYEADGGVGPLLPVLQQGATARVAWPLYA